MSKNNLLLVEQDVRISIAIKVDESLEVYMRKVMLSIIHMAQKRKNSKIEVVSKNDFGNGVNNQLYHHFTSTLRNLIPPTVTLVFYNQKQDASDEALPEIINPACVEDYKYILSSVAGKGEGAELDFLKQHLESFLGPLPPQPKMSVRLPVQPPIHPQTQLQPQVQQPPQPPLAQSVKKTNRSVGFMVGAFLGALLGVTITVVLAVFVPPLAILGFKIIPACVTFFGGIFGAIKWSGEGKTVPQPILNPSREAASSKNALSNDGRAPGNTASFSPKVGGSARAEPVSAAAASVASQVKASENNGDADIPVAVSSSPVRTYNEKGEQVDDYTQVTANNPLP